MWANSSLREEIKGEYGIQESYPNPDKESIKELQIRISWTQKEIEEIIQYMQDCRRRIPPKLNKKLYVQEVKLKDLKRQLDTYK
jgi:hypothetical protein